MVKVGYGAPLRRGVALLLAVCLVCTTNAWAQPGATAGIRVLPGTTIYVVTQETLIGKKDRVAEGQVVACKVWRDVVVDDHVVIREGTPVYVKVDEFKKKRMAGRRGKIALGAYETQAVDGTTVRLAGGYLKQGKSKVAQTALLAGMLLLPLLLLKGKAAELPRHTVFDAHVDATVTIAVGEQDRVPLAEPDEAAGLLAVDVDYRRLEIEKKPKVFDLLVRGAGTGDRLAVSAVNGAAITPIAMENVGLDADGRLRSTVSIKELGKQLRPGLNELTVSGRIDGTQARADVLLEIEI